MDDRGHGSQALTEGMSQAPNRRHGSGPCSLDAAPQLGSWLQPHATPPPPAKPGLGLEDTTVTKAPLPSQDISELGQPSAQPSACIKIPSPSRSEAREVRLPE